jgi:ATP-dependent helicase HepA
MVPGSLVRLRSNARIGPGRITGSTPQGLAQVALLIGRETRLVSPGVLAHFPLYVGQKVAAVSSLRQLVIREVHEAGLEGLRRCVVSDGQSDEILPESAFVPEPPHLDDPVSYLEALQWDRPHHFFARMALTNTVTQWNEATEGLPTLLGARVRPLGHQLYAVRRVLGDRVPRFLLADEVGLGKTIEAGLVIQALMAADPQLSVLILAPGSMSRQWLCELYLRFGARVFTHIAQGQSNQVSIEERRRQLESSTLIVSMTALLANSDIRAALLGRSWGLIVVDEAHQFPPGHDLYPTLRELSRKCRGFLALSATPSKRELKGLVGILSLVSPDAYAPTDIDILAQRLDERRKIWGVLSSTAALLEATQRSIDGGPMDPTVVDFIINDWSEVMPNEPEVQRMLDQVREGELEVLDELVAYVQEHFRVDHRIIRTRRKTLDHLGTAFAQREFIHLEYSPTAVEVLLAEHFAKMPLASVNEEWVLRLIYHEALGATPGCLLNLLEGRSNALDANCPGDVRSVAAAIVSDPGPREMERLRQALVDRVAALPGERDWIAQAIGLAREWVHAEGYTCARHAAVAQRVASVLVGDPEAKVLVFAQERDVVEDFTNLLQLRHPTAGAGAFHHGLSDQELEQVALRFQRDPAHRVLVCDELGGEGRNFEMADWVVHLDTPVSVARIEQRIGRLDRIGRDPTRPIRSLVVRGPSLVERALQDIHEKVFSVYTRSVGGLEFVLPRLQGELRRAMGCGEDLELVAQRLRKEVEATLHDVDEDFERSLDSSRQSLEQAQDLAEMLEEDAAGDAKRVTTHWLGTLGVKEHNDHRGVQFTWSSAALDEPLPGYMARDGSTSFGTFERDLALSNEALPFFAPGHRLVDSAIAALTTSSKGRATVLVRRLGLMHSKKCFVVLTGMSVLGESACGECELPAGLRTRAHRYLWPAAQTCCVRIHANGEDSPEVVRDYMLEEKLTQVFRGDSGDRALEIDDLVQFFEPGRLWRAVRQGVEVGQANLSDKLKRLRDEAAADLDESLRAELGYYRGVVRRGVASESEAAKSEIQLRDRLLHSVRQARVHIDGVGLVIGGGF